MNEFENLSVKFNKNTLTLSEIDKRAEELGLNRSRFVVLALQMMINFDLDFWKRIEKYSKNLNIPSWLVIQNMIIKRFADDEADLSVWGPGRHDLLDEFAYIRDEDGVRTITGEELYKRLYTDRVLELIDDKIKILCNKEKYLPLSEDEREFLIKNQAGRAWYESDEFKKLQQEAEEARKFLEQAQQKGHIQSGAIHGNINIKLISELVKAMKNGLPEEAALEELKNIFTDKNDEWNER